MNDIILTSNHIATLADLQAIAKKHDCYITIGHRVSTDNEMSEDDIKEALGFDKDDEIGKELFEGYDTDSTLQITSVYWFELHSNEKGMIGYLCVSNTTTSVKMSAGCGFHLNSEDLEKWLDKNTAEWCDDNQNPYFDVEKQEEKLGGVFEGKQVNFYREGICSREFSNLVCDYFGEPRIERVY